MHDRMSISPYATREERLEFELTRLRLRCENLERIVHELLRDRVHPSFADAWLELPAHSSLSNYPFQDRGEHIRTIMNRWNNENTKWPERPPPGSCKAPVEGGDPAP
jgi:hypothetical protein